MDFIKRAILTGIFALTSFPLLNSRSLLDQLNDDPYITETKQLKIHVNKETYSYALLTREEMLEQMRLLAIGSGVEESWIEYPYSKDKHLFVEIGGEVVLKKYHVSEQTFKVSKTISSFRYAQPSKETTRWHLHNYGENKNRIFELIDYTPFKQQQKSKKNENHSEIFEKLEKTFGYSTLNPSPQDLKTSKIDHKRYQATKSGIVTADGYTTYEYREDLKDTTYKAENQIITITNNHLIIGTYFDQPTTEFIREHQKEIDSIGAVVEKQWLEQEKN